LLRVAIAGTQRFRFGALAATDGAFKATDGAFKAKGETGAATAALTAFGFRISRLPRRCSLANSFSS